MGGTTPNMDGIGADALGVQEQLASNSPAPLLGQGSLYSSCQRSCLNSSSALNGLDQCIRDCVADLVAQRTNPDLPSTPLY